MSEQENFVCCCLEKDVEAGIATERMSGKCCQCSAAIIYSPIWIGKDVKLICAPCMGKMPDALPVYKICKEVLDEVETMRDAAKIMGLDTHKYDLFIELSKKHIDRDRDGNLLVSLSDLLDIEHHKEES